MSFLGIKKKEENIVDIVKNYRRQGLSDSQIIQNMQKAGYTPQEIHNSLTQADLNSDMQPLPPLNTSDSLSLQAPSLTSPPVSPLPPQITSNEESPIKEYNKEQIQDMVEEIAEAIIEEKWDDLLKDIDKIVDWKNKTETRLTSLEQSFKDLKDNFNELHKAIISKIGEYDQNILNVGGEIKAMEKVFADVLPVFTDNVNELSRIVDKVKKKRK